VPPLEEFRETVFELLLGSLTGQFLMLGRHRLVSHGRYAEQPLLRFGVREPRIESADGKHPSAAEEVGAKKLLRRVCHGKKIGMGDERARPSDVL